MKKQIIVSGGGGFTRKESNHALERYIIAQTHKENPRICFLPQASNEDVGYVLKFIETFYKLGARPDWVSIVGALKIHGNRNCVKLILSTSAVAIRKA